MVVNNPILKGFHPDPSIIRVGEDYYLATSTFEWWPGVSIHHSRDLAHWELLTYPLNRMSQLDLRGVGASQGVWAPCLTYDKGVYYLLYTIVRSFYCNMYDTNNFLVTGTDINGPWSEPIALNNFGFDPSLFHDDDGRKYMVCMVTDHRIPKKFAGRLMLQEYDVNEKRMTGTAREIYRADKIFLEGPHIFKRNAWYYLFSADTGTGEGHGQSIQRAKSVWGPYEMYQPPTAIRSDEYEAYSIMTTRHHPEYPMQKAGHCDLVETQNGDWYTVHLMGRALENRNPADSFKFPGHRRYPLGRETSLQKMTWTEDEWLVLENGTTLPDLEVNISGFEPHPFPPGDARDDFDSAQLDLEFQSLRIPLDETFISLTERPGHLRMYGREGLGSKFAQTLVARRRTEFCFRASAMVEFEPEIFKEMAGLICMYDNENYLYLHISYDEDMGKCLSLVVSENKKYCYPAGYIPLPDKRRVILSAEARYDNIQFYYQVEGEERVRVGQELDCSFLSDEACREGWFTGTMIGICCQDLTGGRRYADFDWFCYEEL